MVGCGTIADHFSANIVGASKGLILSADRKNNKKGIGCS